MKWIHHVVHAFLQVSSAWIRHARRYFNERYSVNGIWNSARITYCVFRYIICIFITLIPLSGSANELPVADLLDVAEQAFTFDPVFKAAYLKYLSSLQGVPIARANLLPHLEGYGTVTRVIVRSKFEVVDQDPLTPPFLSGSGNFTQQFYDVTLRQPLFNIAAWKELKSSQATARQAQAEFSAATQDLIIRVALAYFAVLEAEDLLRFTRSEKETSYKLLEESARRYEKGLETITTIYEARAEYDRNISYEIAQENDLKNARAALKRLTGRAYTNLARIEGEAPLIHPKPEQLENWIDTAAYQNYLILAGQYAVEAAKQKIDVQRAANMPTVDAVSSYTLTNGSSVVAIAGVIVPVGTLARFKLEAGSAGVYARWPLIQGGLIAASALKARYDYEGTIAKLQDTHQMVIVNTEKNYNDVVSGISRVTADQRAIISGEASLESVEKQFRVGTRTIVDVLAAQRNLFDAQRAHAIDTYAYVLATLRLKFDAGILSNEDLIQINDWLYGAPDELKQEYAIKSYESILTSIEDADYEPKRDANDIEKVLIPEQELAEASQEISSIQTEQKTF